MKLTVRRLNALDIGHLSKLKRDFDKEMQIAYPHYDEAEHEKHMLHVLGTINSPLHLYYIAFDGKKAIGYLLAYIGEHPYGQPSRVGVAQEMYVTPAKRKGKVAWRLIREAVKAALAAGAEGFEAVGMYGKTDKRWERFGFTPHLTYGHMDKAKLTKLVRL